MTTQAADGPNGAALVRPELHFAFVRPLGADVDALYDHLGAALNPYGFLVRRLKYSDYIEKLAKMLPAAPKRSFEYYMSRMDAGDQLRSEHGPEVLALCAMTEAAEIKASTTLPEGKRGIAFIHDSLMNEAEVDALRQAYDSLLFVVSLQKAESKRRDKLCERLLTADTPDAEVDEKVDALMERDLGRKRGGDKRRLSFEATFHRADVFLDGAELALEVQSEPGHVRESAHPVVKRLLRQIFAYPHGTPTREERAMAHAFTASLGSGSLARRVGAAIETSRGGVCAVGHNDVPMAFGGVADFDDIRQRDVHYDYLRKSFPVLEADVHGADSNDLVKLEMLRDLFRNAIDDGIVAVGSGLKEVDLLAALLKSNLVRSSQFFELFGYGRTVHAEMNAITTAARTGLPVDEGTLYTTTFPCHECARHIVAAGIGRVVYVEPYPKSRVGQLHSDSIHVVDDWTEHESDRVIFRPFVGVSHLRLTQLYSGIDRKHDDPKTLETYGTATKWSVGAHNAIRPSIVGDDVTQRLRAAAIEQAERVARKAVGPSLGVANKDEVSEMAPMAP